MNPSLDHCEQPAAVRGVVPAFTVLGALCQAFALPAMIVGAFAGPHLLIPATVLFAFGSASIAAGNGIARGFRVAYIGGVVVAATATIAAVAWATALTFQTEEPWPVRFLLGLMALTLGAPFAAAAVALVKAWPANHAD